MMTIRDLGRVVHRHGTVSVETLLAVMGVVITLIVIAAWNVRNDVQGLHASQRALEIETANYRAALEALIEQVDAAQPAVPDLEATSSTPSDEPRAPATSTFLPSPVAAISPASMDTAVAARERFKQALARLEQARASAEAADAPALASRAYRASVALESEAHEFSNVGRMADALVRAVEAAASFRAAEIEARAEAAAFERMRDVAAAVHLPPAEASDAITESEDLILEAPPPLRTAATVVDAEQPIRDVIAQYVSGLESRSLPTLKRVWPSLGGSQERAIRTEFENARTVQTLFTDPRITIDGDTTTVTGFRMYSLVTHDGQRLSSLTRTTLTLRRNGNLWVIERIVHQK